MNTHLEKFSAVNDGSMFVSKEYKNFEEYVNSYASGEGMIGENSYLSLWKKSDIEELNDAYEVKYCLKKCILIGSDGGDTAYGINENGQFFSVPFIGMETEMIELMGNNFEEFIEKLFNCEREC